MIEVAETTSYSNVLESERLFQEIDTFLKSLGGYEQEEGYLKTYESKLKLNMNTGKLGRLIGKLEL